MIHMEEADTGPAWVCVGVDIGGRGDFSAIAALTPDGGGLHCPYAARLPNATAADADGHYRVLAGRLRAVADAYLQATPGEVRMILDATGVGGGVAEMVREELPDSRRLRFVPTVITGGDRATYKAGRWTIPKANLIEGVMVHLEQGTLSFGEFNDAGLLRRELSAYEGIVGADGRTRYGNGNQAAHDDLVVALSLAVAGAARDDGVRVHNPARRPSGVSASDALRQWARPVGR